jgi:hypothetical protein
MLKSRHGTSLDFRWLFLRHRLDFPGLTPAKISPFGIQPSGM